MSESGSNDSSQQIAMKRGSGGSRGGESGASSPPSRRKIIKIHGIIIGSHTCNVTFDSTSGLALQKLRLHAYSVREGTSIARSTRFSARLGNKID